MLRQPRRSARQSVTAELQELPGGWRTAGVLLFLVAVWLATRVILLLQMQHAAGVIGVADALDRRERSTPTPMPAAASPPSSSANSVHVVLTSNGNPCASPTHAVARFCV